MKTFADFQIELGGRAGTDLYTQCPKCSPDRAKSKARVLHVNTEKGVWYCNHCAWSGGLDKPEKQGEPPRKVVVKPEYVAPTEVPASLVSWFAERKIPEAVVKRNRIDLGQIFMPQVEREVEVMQFPYYVGGECANVKFRSMEGKMFRQVTGAQKVLFGLDDLQQATECIIVEGEIDKLSLEVAGHLNVVSVPDGAPAEGAKNYGNKFEYLVNCESYLKPLTKIILAVDNDGPGRTLEEELARRLGPDRCWKVRWPHGCKDANDVLREYGADELKRCIAQARPCPLDGVMEAADVADKVLDLYRKGLPPGLSTGWYTLDPYYTVKPGEMTIVTGVPSHGKSEWLDALTVQMAMAHQWRFGMCSPENMPLERHISKLAEKYIGLPFGGGRPERMNMRKVVEATQWVHEFYKFVVPDEAISIAELLEKSKQLVTRYGIRGLVIDPWNEFDHRRSGNMSETEYISDCLGKIRRFARNYGVHTWIVAHPAKLLKDKNGDYPVPTPYDISGSAHWRNKADNCITIWRDVRDNSKPTDVHIQKIRFKEVGKVGLVPMPWNPLNGRYDDILDIPNEDILDETHDEGKEVQHDAVGEQDAEEQQYAF